MKLPPNYINVDQQTAEWLQLRCGSVTAYRIKDVVAKLKNGKESAARHTYKMELLTELLTGRAFEHYVSQAMDFGSENEGLARETYAMNKGVEVERIGYVKHPSIPRTGCSPDGLVGDDGLVELKVPTTTTHLEYLIDGVVPEEYKPQMMWQMACTGRQWCDYVSYDPRLPEEFGLFIIRFNRDDAAIAAMEHEVESFIAELNAMVLKLPRRHVEQAPAGQQPPKAEIPSFA